MTPIEKILQRLLGIDVWGVVKVFLLFALVLYMVFAIVVVRQEQLMSRTVNGGLDLPLKLITWLHLLLAVGVFVFAWAYL